MTKKPVIVVDGGKLALAVAAAESAIMQDYARWNLYQREGLLMKVVQATEKDNRFVHRPLGAVILKVASDAMVFDVLNQVAVWEKHNAKGEVIEIDCPDKVVRVMQSRAGMLKLPELLGVINAPAMRAGGTILDKPGYDEATGLLLEKPLAAWRPLPFPVRAETADQKIQALRQLSEQAVQVLSQPFEKFPFKGAADRSVLISAILTGLQRRLLRSAPAHCFDAPMQGSGKSLLADCVSIIVTGREVASIACPEDKEELRKSLLASLLAGDAIINIDNVTTAIDSDAL